MRVLIENEAGSRIKNTYDERTFAFVRCADVSLPYPYPYGFVIGTSGGDGDAVDCFLLTGKPLVSGSVVECEPVALFEQIEDGETDHKVLAVLPGEHRSPGEAERDTLRRFVSGVFAHVPGKTVTPGRLLDRQAALDYLQRCRTD